MRRLVSLSFILSTVVACGSDGEGGGGDDGGALPPAEDVTCDGAARLALSEDPGAPGPWPVGARTITVAGLKTEVWYPAPPGSQAGLEKARYDIREQLLPGDQGKIPDAENPYQGCECYRELPLDGAHGPYPVIYFAHGTAGFRSQSLHQMTHWASRGFIVVASDHPKLMLQDALSFNLGGDQAGEATMVLDGILVATGEAAFLAGHLDASKLAFAGHSAGGNAISRFGARPGVKLLISMASGGSSGGTATTLVLGGTQDNIAQWDSVQQGYASTPKPKHLVGLDKAGHLAFSDLCWIGRDRGGLLEVAISFGIDVNPLIQRLAQDGCEEGQLSAERGWAIINYATSAALEQQLACGEQMAAKLAAIREAFSEVATYEQQL